MDQVTYFHIDQIADHAVARKVIQDLPVPADTFHQDFPQCDTFQHVGVDHPRAQAIVEVVRGVCQFVRHVCNLRFEIAAQVRAELARIGNIIFRFMLDHALAHFPSEVQAGEFRVALFEFGDDTQGLLVVVESRRSLSSGAASAISPECPNGE